MRKFAAAILVVGAFALAANSADAQVAIGSCDDTLTAEECYEHYYNAYLALDLAAAGNAKQAGQRQQLAAKSTGSSAQTGGTTSTVTDLIPILSFTGLISDAGRDADTGLLSANLNLPLFARRSNDLQIKATVDTEPELFAAISESLGETVREARAKELLKQVGEIAAFTIEATYSATGGRFGRTFGSYRDRFGALFQASSAGAVGVAEDRLADGLLAILDMLDARGIDGGATMSTLGTGRDDLEQSIRRTARQDVEVQTLLEQAYADRSLDRYSDLVNNQDQLTITASLTRRHEFVGADEWGVKAVFERGFANISDFEAENAAACGSATDAASVDCLDAYEAYVDRNSGAIDKADRLALSVEVMRTRAYALELADDSLTLDLPASSMWKAGLGYGRYINLGAADTENDRVDLSIEYEDPSSAIQNERFVATLTITKRTGSTTFPLSLVWANKSELLTDTTAQFGAHFGVKFDLGGGS